MHARSCTEWTIFETASSILGCVDNSNCEAGYQCSGHQCVPVTTCTDDAFCNEGVSNICDIENSPYTTCFYCEGGECKPGRLRQAPSKSYKNVSTSLEKTHFFQDVSQMPTALVGTHARITFASTLPERSSSSRSLSEQRLVALTARRRA